MVKGQRGEQQCSHTVLTKDLTPNTYALWKMSAFPALLSWRAGAVIPWSASSAGIASSQPENVSKKPTPSLSLSISFSHKQSTHGQTSCWRQRCLLKNARGKSWGGWGGGELVCLRWDHSLLLPSTQGADVSSIQHKWIFFPSSLHYILAAGMFTICFF